MEACVACADEFIHRFLDGYNTHIEQGGNPIVSGGQPSALYLGPFEAENSDSG